ISVQTLAEPATSPPLGFMAVTIENLPWTVKIYATYKTYIVLGDVFQAVYQSLRTNITRSELDSVSQAEQSRVSRAYMHRYRRQRSRRAYDAEKYGGIKHIDFLLGHSSFLGIS
ncbi:hypothetical protein GALMADRAFT_27435, partial [Galerina marginata CBS 339.88]